MDYLTKNEDILRKIADDIGRMLVELGMRVTLVFIDTTNFFTYMKDGKKLAKKGKNAISGKQAFKLSDTHGFPVELTREIARERGITVDEAGFEKEMEQQRERARRAELTASGKEAVSELTSLSRSYEATPFVGYHDLKHRSVIIDLLVDSSIVDTVAKGQSASLVLETTPFYGEMGGQMGDAGQRRL